MKSPLLALCTLIVLFLAGCGDVRDTSVPPIDVKPAAVTPVEKDALSQIEKVKSINEALSNTNGQQAKTIADLRAERDAALSRESAAKSLEIQAHGLAADLTKQIRVKEREASDAKDQAILGWFAFGLGALSLALGVLAYFAGSLQFV